jgi:hypothetical protein
MPASQKPGSGLETKNHSQQTAAKLSGGKFGSYANLLEKSDFKI